MMHTQNHINNACKIDSFQLHLHVYISNSLSYRDNEQYFHFQLNMIISMRCVMTTDSDQLQ